MIAELVVLAKGLPKESKRGGRFNPPLDGDQLAFHGAVATNESQGLEQGRGRLAQIASELEQLAPHDADAVS